MAAPVVAGTVALMLQVNPDLGGSNVHAEMVDEVGLWPEGQPAYS